eukprot:gene2696-2996_t
MSQKRPRSDASSDHKAKRQQQQAKLTQIYAFQKPTSDTKSSSGKPQHAGQQNPAHNSQQGINWWQMPPCDPMVAHVRLSGSAQQIPVKLSALSALCPCDLLLDFLPKQLANQLLSVMLQQSASWEEWLHEVPKSSKPLSPHPLSGPARVNLTFRQQHQAWAAAVPSCHCGKRAIMKCSVKGTRYQYFYKCDNSTAERPCSFYKPAAELMRPDRLNL